MTATAQRDTIGGAFRYRMRCAECTTTGTRRKTLRAAQDDADRHNRKHHGPRRAWFLVPKGADVARELHELADAPVFDRRAAAEHYARNRTPDGEAWRDHFELYEVRPVIA